MVSFLSHRTVLFPAEVAQGALQCWFGPATGYHERPVEQGTPREARCMKSLQNANRFSRNEPLDVLCDGYWQRKRKDGI
jgi:hypothetical protein